MALKQAVAMIELSVAMIGLSSMIQIIDLSLTSY